MNNGWIESSNLRTIEFVQTVVQRRLEVEVAVVARDADLVRMSRERHLATGRRTGGHMQTTNKQQIAEI